MSDNTLKAVLIICMFTAFAVGIVAASWAEVNSSACKCPPNCCQKDDCCKDK